MKGKLHLALSIGYIIREDWTGDSKISDADRKGKRNIFMKSKLLSCYGMFFYVCCKLYFLLVEF